MSIQIKTIDLLNNIVIPYRDVNIYGEHIQSVNIFQTDGSFITTEPFKNRLVWYPQSPSNATNSWVGKWQIFDSFQGYGNLYFPLDARFDFIRRKLWIADSGNQRVLSIDLNSGNVVKNITNMYFVHSICLNINDGDIFIKSIKDTNLGVIFNYDINGNLKNTFEFYSDFGITDFTIRNTYDFVSKFPLPSSMAFDYARWRLWWTSSEYVHMADLINKNIVSLNTIDSNYKNSKGIDIDLDSGNAFVSAQQFDKNNWEILQIFRDNNKIISTAFLADEFASSSSSSSSSSESFSI